jgi:uncharacterized repeat protein (TIGR01451 family)
MQYRFLSMKKIFLALISIVLLLTVVSSTDAAGTVNCQPIYGGGQTCAQAGNLLINKMVSDPSKPNQEVFVENLDSSSAKFVPGQVIKFKITVTNTGGSTINKVTVKDILPRTVTSISGPGNLDGRTLSFDVTNLAPNESRSFVITGTVVGANELPNENTPCDVNQVTGTSSEVSGQSSDNAQFCIQKNAVGGPQVTTTTPPATKGGLPVAPSPKLTTTPSTGPESLALMALFPSGAFGFFLRKKASK